MLENKRDGEFLSFAETLMPLALSYAEKFDFKSKNETSLQESIDRAEPA